MVYRSGVKYLMVTKHGFQGFAMVNDNRAIRGCFLIYPDFIYSCHMFIEASALAILLVGGV